MTHSAERHETVVYTSGTIPALFLARVAASGDDVALREFVSSTGACVDAYTWREWSEVSLDVAASIISSGATVGETIAILAGNVALWPLADLGAMLAGLISVGIYPTASMAQVREVLADSGARIVIVDRREQLEKVRLAVAELPDRLTIVADMPHAELHDHATGTRELTWRAWLASGRAAREHGSEVVAECTRRMAVAQPDDIAMLVYTSGSTGAPKGARMSQRCVVESARSVRDTLALSSDDSSLSFLPYCHSGERIFGLYTRITCGMTATLVDDHRRIWDAAVAAAPTIFGGLPRLFEKVYEGLLAERRDVSPAAAAVWDRAIVRGRERSTVRRSGGSISEALESAWRRDVQAIAPTLARYFGPRLRLATSGGAALPIEVAEYLDACGVAVLGAYGQTEHLCATFNRPGRYRHDSVGPPMPGTTLRIADDGEVLLRRSALTFSGYHRLSEASRDAFTDDGEWLLTGDVGAVDADGFLRIVGRRRELIALSNGKKVAPLGIESRLCEAPLISHAMLYGEGRPFVVALLTLRGALLERWQRERGLEGAPQAIIANAELLADVQRAVDRVNADLSRPERVRRFAILGHDLSVDAGELTPTHKLRREVISSRYALQLHALYGDHA